MYKTKFAYHKHYLLGLLFSRNVKKTYNRPKCNTIFYYLIKERTHKPSKVAASKKNFSRVYVLDITYFD